MTTFLPLLFSCLQLAFDMEVLKSITVQVGLPKRLSEKLKKIHFSKCNDKTIKIAKNDHFKTLEIYQEERKERGRKTHFRNNA